MDKTITLNEQEKDILVGLIHQEIRTLADTRLKLAEKDIDCSSLTNRIGILHKIAQRLY